MHSIFICFMFLCLMALKTYPQNLSIYSENGQLCKDLEINFSSGIRGVAACIITPPAPTWTYPPKVFFSFVYHKRG